MSEPGQKNSREEEPVIEREELVKKLEKIPTEVLRSILTNQVDLEIRLKHKELALTEEEIGKCEAQMLALRKFLEVPNEISFRSEPSDFTLKYYSILNESLSVNFTRLQQQQYQQQPVLRESIFEENGFGKDGIGHSGGAHTYRTRSTTSSLRPSIAGSTVAISGCLYRRTDGVVVKLTCVDCHRSNFSSAQGFLNHNRIAHSKEFTSQDAAALRCGEALAEEFQDEEGLSSILNLKRQGLDPSKNLNSGYQYEAKSEKRLNERRGSGIEARAERRGSGIEPRHDRHDRHERNDRKSGGRKSEEVGSHELMKKLIDNGITQDAEAYQAMVQELRSEIPNSHLFEGEKEDDEALKNGERTESGETTERGERTERNGKRTERNGKSPEIVESMRNLGGERGTSSKKIGKEIKETGTKEIGGSIGGPNGSEGPRDEGKFRADTGGKYENRLRRRKSRDTKEDEDDRKRRR